ncbi:MAG: hypothetical protein RJA61_279 [Candidatus Parcubacteria bacterium]|jgi:plastocyanin
MKNLIILIVVVLLAVWGFSYFKKDTDMEVKEVEKVVSYSKTQPSLRASADGITVISYTAKGFTPFIVEVQVGETVRFVNNRSDKALRVVSTSPDNSDLFYPGFSAASSIAKGETFELPFTKVGAWSFTNLNDDSQQGVIIVTE